jgi:hypothetical protein
MRVRTRIVKSLGMPDSIVEAENRVTVRTQMQEGFPKGVCVGADP